MLQDLDTYLGSMDMESLKGFLAEIKGEGKRLDEEKNAEPEVAQMVQFVVALVENIEEEIQGVKTLSELEFRKKVRVYAMLHFCNEILGMGEDDMDWDDDFEDEIEDEEMKED